MFRKNSIDRRWDTGGGRLHFGDLAGPLGRLQLGVQVWCRVSRSPLTLVVSIRRIVKAMLLVYMLDFHWVAGGFEKSLVKSRLGSTLAR